MSLPDNMVVEIAFASNPLDASPTYTDVSAYVATVEDGGSALTIKRGRTYELDEIQPGTLNLTFRNDDGRFTPSKTASPYYPNVVTGKRIRVKATHANPNLVLNAGFESTVSPWSGNGCTFVRSTAQFHTGVASGLMTPDGVSLSAQAIYDTAIGSIVPNIRYALSCWARSGPGVSNVTIAVVWFNAAGGIVSSNESSAFVLTAATWTFLDFDCVAPLGASYGSVRVRENGTPAAAKTLHVDDVAFSVSPGIDSTTYVRYDGYIDSYSDSFDATGNTKHCTVSATDKLKYLSRYTLLRSNLEQTILKCGPAVYWPMTDPDTATTAGSIANYSQPSLKQVQIGAGGTLLFGSNAGQGPADDGQPTVIMTPSTVANGLYLRSSVNTPFIGHTQAITVGIHYKTSVASRHLFSVYTSGSVIAALQLEMNASGALITTWEDTLGNSTTGGTGPTGNNDNTTRFAAVTVNMQTGLITTYEDGVLMSQLNMAGTNGNLIPTFGTVSIGRQVSVAGGGGDDLWSGAFSHFFACNREMTLTDLVEIFAAGQDGFNGDDTGDRTEKVVAYAGFVPPVLNANTDFEVNASNWTAISGATITRDNTATHVSHGGSWTLKIDPDGVGSNCGAFSEFLPVTPFYTYFFEAWLYVLTGTYLAANLGLVINWYDSAFVLLDTTVDAFPMDDADHWEYRYLYGDAPEDAVWARARIILSGVAGTSDFVWVDDAAFYGHNGTFNSGESTVGRQTLTGLSPLDAIRDLVFAEFGVFYVSKDGEFVFRDRAFRWALPSLFDFTADQIQGDLEITLDETLIINDIRGTDATGANYRSRNQTSITSHGLFADEIQTLIDNEDDTQSRLDALINYYSEPAPRSPSVTIDVYTQAALYSTILGTDIWQRFKVTGMPSNSPSSTLDFIIEGYEETIAQDSYVIQFEVSPASLANYLLLDDNEFGLLDNNRLAW